MPRSSGRDTTHVTRLLHAIHAGDAGAADQLMPLVYAELMELARGLMQNERAHHTLQPTALVHEAWLRLGGAGAPAKDRDHFRAIAAKAMRNVLVDHARARKAEKRGGPQTALRLDDTLAVHGPDSVDPLELDELLVRLAEKDEQLAKLVELRFFGGLTLQETGSVLGLSRRQVDHAWTLARAWLHRELRRGEESP